MTQNSTPILTSTAVDTEATPPGTAPPIRDKHDFHRQFQAVTDNIRRVIKGKDTVVRTLLVALLAEGHVLLEDMPGTGKTMLARALSQSIRARHNRVQCTPDLLPSDITGFTIFDQTAGKFFFRQGPVFANILLADEINRATPKTQSALLEAMQERRVSIDNKTHDLPQPFLVLATQNPIELAGTFPLPEAQLDRFMLKLEVGYANRESEIDILEANLVEEPITTLPAVIELDTVVAMMAWARGVAISRAMLAYIVDICQATRSDPALLMGASSRAAQSLMRASRVLAAAQGREDVVPDDIRALVKATLVHRLVLSPEAELRGESVDKVIERIVTRVKVGVELGTPVPVAAAAADETAELALGSAS